MKVRIIIFFTSTMLSLLYLTACYYDSEEFLYPQLESNCDTTNYTYITAVKPILASNCYSCHSNANSGFGANIKLEDFTDLKVIVDNGKLEGSIMHLGGFSPMPKGGGKISDCNLRIIRKWLANGALNN